MDKVLEGGALRFIRFIGLHNEKSLKALPYSDL